MYQSWFWNAVGYPPPTVERQDWDERYAGDDLLWHAEPNRFLVEETSHLEPETALDLACGEGRNAIWLAERGWRTTGVDFSPVALGKARRFAEQRGVQVEWVEADLRDWTAPGSFDLVIVMYLHLPPHTRRSTISSAATAVAPGGTILVVGHDRENLTAGIGGPQDETVLYSSDNIVAILVDTGDFAVRRAAQVRRPVETDQGPVEALDTLVRAVRAA